MSRRRLDFERLDRQKRIDDAAAYAEWVIHSCGITQWPVRPLEIAAAEAPLLKVCCGDYRGRFDGRLEYHHKEKRFLLFYNTKYDAVVPSGENAPRTRFSIAHELGHFFLEEHHEYLRRGGSPHPSRTEFVSDVMMEQEADAFAASLLMPNTLFRPLVNDGELTLDEIRGLANKFRTSFVSTAIRAVQMSDFYCAITGLRGGKVAWTFVSQPLVQAGFYPGPRGGGIASSDGREAWLAFEMGQTVGVERPGWARDWFQIYDDSLNHKPVTEEYLPIPIMNTLLVLLNIPEDEVFTDDHA